MSETKWTPGPWRIQTKGTMGNCVEGPTGKRLFDGDDGYRGVALFMAAINSGNAAEEEANRIANAHLIAAAPELYEALDEIRSLIRAYDDDVDGDWPGDVVKRLDNIDAALAKARGE